MSTILNANDKSKAAWNLINSNRMSKKCASSEDIHVNFEGKEITSQQEVSTLLNDYFSSIVNKLITERDNNCNQHSYKKVHNKSKRLPHNIFLAPMTTKEFYEITDKVCKKFSAGFDDVPASILKTIVTFLAEPLIFIINQSFLQGKFPDVLKKAIIKPCFKNGDRTCLGNYRPLAILSVFSKIFEMAMCSRILSFLNKYKIFNASQHGFIQGKSTISAICTFVTDVLNSIDEHNQTYGIFYDFSKAFDTVNHSILLNKLNNMGISGLANKWIESFLKDRIQIVQIRGANGTFKSNEVIVNVGVPQGSTIAPLLFILFTNYITANVNNGSLTLFADDTTHFISSNKEEIVQISRTAVLELEDWCVNNDLFLNKSKTILMQFGTKNGKLNSSPLIQLGGTSIREKDCTKFLGLIIDNKLDWGKHIHEVGLKVASGCFLIKRVLELCDFNTAKLVYFAYIHSRLQYGIILWGSSPHASRLFILQKKALRILAKASFNPCAEVFYKDSCRLLFKKFKILTLPSLYIYMTIMYVVNNKNKLLLNSEVHSHNTRSLKDIHIKKHSLKMSDRCPIYAGSLFYNKLPNYIKVDNILHFKVALKEFLIDKCIYNINEFL